MLSYGHYLITTKYKQNQFNALINRTYFVIKIMMPHNKKSSGRNSKRIQNTQDLKKGDITKGQARIYAALHLAHIL